MTFESAQTNFTGQKGWNDLAPDALDLNAAQKNARGKIRPKRVVTPINQILADAVPIQSTSTTSPPPLRKVSGPPPPLAPPAAAKIPAATTTTSTPEIEKIEWQSVKSQLTSISQKPSSLSEEDIASLLHKIDSQLPALPQNHLAFLKSVLESANDRARARKMLVDYGLVNSNVSSWTVPVRRLIDSLNI